MYYGGFEKSQFHSGVTLPLHRHLPPHYRPPYHFPLPVPALMTEPTVTPRQPVSFVSHAWKSTVKVIHWLVEKTGRSDKAKFLWEGSGRNRILLMELILSNRLFKKGRYTVQKVDYHNDFPRILVWDSPPIKLSYVESSVFRGYSTAVILCCGLFMASLLLNTKNKRRKTEYRSENGRAASAVGVRSAHLMHNQKFKVV